MFIIYTTNNYFCFDSNQNVVISKADYSKRNNMIRRYNLSFSNASSSYIIMNDNKLDNNRDDSSFLSKKIAVQSFKQTKSKRLT